MGEPEPLGKEAPDSADAGDRAGEQSYPAIDAAVRAAQPLRGAHGRFAVGNLAGRPPGALNVATKLGREAFEKHAEQALEVLVKNLSNRSAKVRHVAAELILNYAFGKPAQSLSVDGTLGDVAGELAAALARARERAPLPAAVEPPPPLAASVSEGTVENTMDEKNGSQESAS